MAYNDSGFSQNGRSLEKQLFSQMVALKAWQIWKDEGCPDGKAEEHWRRAEKELEEIREITLKSGGPKATA